jgi:arylsulfatase A-like enzyme
MRTILVTTAVCLLTITGCSAPQGPPNILLLVLDTTRADAVPLDGDPAAPTPRLEELAARGVVYTHARSTSGWTLPAHGSLFTGLYPSRHGAHHESHLLRPEAVTLAELLAATHTRAGFSENPHIGIQKGFAQGFEIFEETWRTAHRAPGSTRSPTIERALAWLETHDRERPFFLFVNLMDPHLPYAPPDAWAQRLAPEGVGRTRLDLFRQFGEREARRFMTGSLQLTRDDMDLLRRLYQAEVGVVDERVGRLLDAVELERTVVVVVGDHGESFGEHGLMEHQLSVYETLLRVPLIVSFTGAFDGGERRADPVQLVDVLPTILDLVGIAEAQRPDVEGVSLLGDGPPDDRPVIAEYMRPLRQRERFREVDPVFDFDRFDRRLRAIQVGTLKLIVSDRGDVELYDLERDAGEQRNIASDRPADTERLASRLVTWLAKGSAAEIVAEPELDAEAIEKLRALGYLD